MNAHTFFMTVRELRICQKNYFRNRDQESLKQSKHFEEIIDREIKRVENESRKRGLDLYSYKYKKQYHGNSIIDYQNEREKINAPYGINVEDGEGNEYTVSLNKFGELEVNSHLGSMIILPSCGNEIVIKQKK